MTIKCFWIEPSGQARLSLRRYAASGSQCAQNGYHDASVFIEDVPAIKTEKGYLHHFTERKPPKDDPRWPTHCTCGYVFQEADNWQLFSEWLYRRADNGEIVTLRKLPPGAMFDAWWSTPDRKGPDGRSLVAICPDGTEWCIDSRASNCTLPDDRAHKCWIRHGEPPNITVDKNGLTCAAGAGSIVGHNGYHGFLRNGEFT